ncbi:Probable cytokinin riboside 5'-monophosphate phosphoribohydrolase LOGL2 (Protein LONELY GUY-like 2) [Durusdinium trenchii]|uniref:Probable cytokinin riboside 5'-monophosphate phosphoribohydrolase LOGL2 (Protein LONELY GUY-like 2) n=1 Tax=Durusdinium trenchii TaxID=1381693 RepID=A0ABP0QP40_9DINO
MEGAQRLGEVMAKRGLVLVYGGGDVGLMGQLARAHDAAGGKVIGVIPQALAPRELSGEGVQPENTIFTETMHERKQIMAELSDAFLCLPGGFGTIEEVVEAITWTQLGIHRKAIGLLNIANYWDPLFAMFQSAVEEGFVRHKQLDIMLLDEDIDRLLDKLLAHQPPKGLSQTWSTGATPPLGLAQT